MTVEAQPDRLRAASPLAASLAAALLLGACASAPVETVTPRPTPAPATAAQPAAPATAASTDPRVGLRAGLLDAEEAIWNLRVLSKTPPPREFIGETNSDLAFTGNFVIQGNYNGYQVWDISNPRAPELTIGYVCPASQSDVSVYQNLLFVSGEGMGGRLDCGTQGVQQAVSAERLRGLRIFDISDIRNPKYIGNVQTCRGSHTHTVLVDPDDRENVYVYISGSAGVRPEAELPGCVSAPPTEDPNSALFRIEVIRVPLADPAKAAIVSSPRIFEGLVEPPRHGLAPADLAEIERARAMGRFVIEIRGQTIVLPPQFTGPLLDSVVVARGGTGTPTAADTAALRAALPDIVRKRFGIKDEAEQQGPRPGPTQCHDITVYPEKGLAGGACEGYGLLLDISDPVNPKRIYAVADSNFSYWHSATFNNAGTKLLFSDEWGGGGQPKCRATDPKEWGANALFTIEGRELRFRSYYKLPAPQTTLENCVAHNGSLIPIPGRDVMVQSWYQGGISIFDFTDIDNPVEIAFFDRGPSDSTRMGPGGSWSVYWYNGNIVSSEIARGLDILELVPSQYLTKNEIDAANTVRLDYLNTQGQPHFEWPTTFTLARAYVDQLERSGGLAAARIGEVREQLKSLEQATGPRRSEGLERLATELETQAGSSSDAAKVRTLAATVRALAAAT